MSAVQPALNSVISQCPMNRFIQTAQDEAPKTDDGGKMRWYKGLEQTAVGCSLV